jgi:hypothetical protein
MFNTPLTYKELYAVKHIQSLEHTQKEVEKTLAFKSKQEKTKQVNYIAIQESGRLIQFSPQVFAFVGGMVGAIMGTLQAQKFPIAFRLQETPQRMVELTPYGKWQKGSRLKETGFDLKRFESGTQNDSYHIRHHARPRFSNESLTVCTALHRLYRNASHDDLYLEKKQDGALHFSHVLESKHGRRKQFTAIYTPTHDLQSLVHYWIENGEERSQAITFLNAEGKAPVLHFSTPHASYHLEADEAGMTQNVRVHLPNGKLFQVNRKAGKGQSTRAGEHLEIRHAEQLVDWQDLSAHEQEALQHPLLFRRLLPSPPDFNLLNPHALVPKALHHVQQKAWWEDLPEAVKRHVPYKAWMSQVAFYTIGASVTFVGLRQFLLSKHSPFSQWLNEHIAFHKEGRNLLMSSTASNSKEGLYVEDTGNEQADAKIGEALRLLNTLGVVKVKAITKHDKKKEVAIPDATKTTS